MADRRPDIDGGEAGRPFDTDVVVIGVGPMGGTTGLALATYGVKVQLVSRWPWTANSPRAHITNQRTMEVFRDLGIEDDVARLATPWRGMGDTYFMKSLAGEEIARLASWGNGDDRASDYLRASPCGLTDLPQDKLEPILVKHAAARGATLRFNTEYLGHDQDADGITVYLRDLTDDREFDVRCRYLVGGDGARSKVLEDAGLALEGHHARAATSYVLFEADLSRFVSHRPGVLYWVVSPDVAYGEIGLGLLRCVEPYTLWIAGWGVDAVSGGPELDKAGAAARIRKLIGDEAQDIDVKSISTWYVNQAHAPVYHSGRVFCGGDAVHRHPPSNGLGSNTSVQDGYNLAWKLAFVLRGLADETLLESYTQERAPVGRQVVERANKSRLEYSAFADAFVAKGSENPVGQGLAALADVGPEGETRRAALQAALRLKDFDYNAQGVELNQRYESVAIIPEQDAPAEIWPRNAEVYHTASTRPGARLPHAWLVDERGCKLSTLDLVGRGAFTLITGISGGAWEAAAAALPDRPVRVVVIGRPGARDAYCTWQELREIEEGGALLVRPDGMICWRHSRRVADITEATRLVSEAISNILVTVSQDDTL